MAMNRSELRAEVRADIRRTTDALANTRIDRWLDWSQDLIADMHTYEEMRKVYTGTTTASQKRYGFPTRMKDIFSLTLQSGASSRKLTYVHASEFDRKVPRPEQTSEGKSSFYVDYGVNFECFRIPDATYTLNLRCSIYPVNFADDDATSALLRKDALITSVAAMIGFLKLREFEDAKDYREEVIPYWYDASLESDHSAEDWTPIARGFTLKKQFVGEYVSNPLIREMP